MKKWMAYLLALVLGLSPVCALAEGRPLEEQLPIELGQNMSVLLMDAVTGTVIYQQKEEEKRPVASITKLMTMLLTMEALDAGVLSLEQNVTVSERAQSMGGSQAYLEAGGVYTVDSLLKSLIVASANDSAVALAELLSGSENAFVDKMNKRAEELGLEDTHYINCTGLPGEGQYTTAKDVAKLSMEVISHPVYFTYSKIWTDQITHRGGRVTDLCNTNRLIRFYDGADGIKTGFTNAAGFCVSATAKRGDQRFIAVVLGGSTSQGRFCAAEELLSYAFANYESKTVLEKDTILGEVPVEKGTEETVSVGCEKDIAVFLKKGQKVTYDWSTQEEVFAPVEEGRTLGVISVYVDEDKYMDYPLVAMESIGKMTLQNGISKVTSRWLCLNR